MGQIITFVFFGAALGLNLISKDGPYLDSPNHYAKTATKKWGVPVYVKAEESDVCAALTMKYLITTYEGLSKQNRKEFKNALKSKYSAIEFGPTQNTGQIVGKLSSLYLVYTALGIKFGGDYSYFTRNCYEGQLQDPAMPTFYHSDYCSYAYGASPLGYLNKKILADDTRLEGTLPIAQLSAGDDQPAVLSIASQQIESYVEKSEYFVSDKEKAVFDSIQTADDLNALDQTTKAKFSNNPYVFDWGYKPNDIWGYAGPGPLTLPRTECAPPPLLKDLI